MRFNTIQKIDDWDDSAINVYDPHPVDISQIEVGG